MSTTIPKGVFDILKTDRSSKEGWKDVTIWQYVESEIREQARRFCLDEIRTPIFERTELFARGVGEASDIVSKEMYTFEDKGGRSMSLRPEGTASVVRSYITHHLDQKPGIQKLFYIVPMFRYERQQAGRYRQHHQFGVEIVGDTSPERDVELIELLMDLFERLGLHHLSLQINSIGDTKSRSAHRKALVEYLIPHKERLSEDSQRRLETNPLRILDSKAEPDIAIVKDAPSILDFLSEECLSHFHAVQQGLDLVDITYTVNPLLVRGLDYYTRTVFEITAGELGAQNSLAGGGRYDTLFKSLGGPNLPALGFGCGIERLIQTLLGQGVALPQAHVPMFFFLPLGEAAKEKSFALMTELRRSGYSADIDLSGKKLKNALKLATDYGTRFLLILGDEELGKGVITLKNTETRASQEVSLHNFTQSINQIVG